MTTLSRTCTSTIFDRHDYCSDCGSHRSEHPARICTGCGHLVKWHGKDADGCARIGAGGWCPCVRTFGAPGALYKD